ncbi:MAG: sporulation inhibitor of replication protein SirA [Bacilli bacterium]|nr:sporulation inhibitor of replication protein SirA [Bacilli bacterium]
MRVFYIFNIKEELKYLYQNHTLTLYQTLKKIYQLEKSDLVYGKSLFQQLIQPLNKLKIDNSLFIKLHQQMPYSKKKDIHYINNLYKNEVSRLEVKVTHIRLEMDNDTTSFISILNELNLNLFVCDFEHFEYFFIDEGKKSCIST